MRFSANLLGLAAAALACSQPLAAQDGTLTLAGDTAVVYDAGNVALLEGSRDFLLTWAQNPEGRIFAIDNERGLVRISPEGNVSLWVRCSDLAGQVCGQPEGIPGRSARSSAAGLDLTPPAGLPICPGDLRCPG